MVTVTLNKRQTRAAVRERRSLQELLPRDGLSQPRHDVGQTVESAARLGDGFQRKTFAPFRNLCDFFCVVVCFAIFGILF